MLGLVLPTTIEEVTQPERASAMIALRRKYNLVTIFCRLEAACSILPFFGSQQQLSIIAAECNTSFQTFLPLSAIRLRTAVYIILPVFYLDNFSEKGQELIIDI